MWGNLKYYSVRVVFHTYFFLSLCFDGLFEWQIAVGRLITVKSLNLTPLPCLWCCCFWRIMLSICPRLLVPLPHFLTLVFSSSPFFRLPQSPEFAAGQKAAAEAQPIWNAAPPSWRSERKEGTRLVVNQAAKSTSCLYAQPTCSACLVLLHCNWQHTLYACLIVSYETCMNDLTGYISLILGGCFLSILPA